MKVWLILKIMTINVFWCQIKHSNSLKTHPEGITKADKKTFDDRDYEGFGFSMSKKDFSKIKRKMIFALMCFVTKVSWLIMFIYHIRSLKTV